MTVLIVDTALPLPMGNPRQRVAAQRLAVLARSGDTRHVTVDLWQTEWPARSMITPDDRLLARLGRPSRSENFLAQAWLASQAEELAGADMFAGIPLTRARDDIIGKHIDRLLESHPVEQVLLADPLLAPLQRLFAARGIDCVLLPNRALEWHALTAARLAGSLAGLWHKSLSDHLAELPRTGAPIPRPTMHFEWDPAFAAKNESILVPATGFAWLDEKILALLVSQLDALSARGLDHPEFVLIGFARTAAGLMPSLLAVDGWQHLRGLCGSARAVLMPFMTEALSDIAGAALSLGTPVIATAADAALHRLSGRPGMLVVPDDGSLFDAIAIATDTQLTTPAYHRQVADIAGSQPDAMVVEQRRGRRRFSAFVGRPRVYYNALSRMLLVEARYRASANAEELRLIGAGGRELNRLMPNANLRSRAIIPVDGGIVIDADDLDGGVGLELHDLTGVVDAVTIPAEEFIPLEAEIAFLENDERRIRGAFWCTAEVAQHALSVGTEEQMTFLDPAAGQAMKGLDGQLFRFDLPLTLGRQDDLLVWQTPAGPYPSPEPLVQRPFRAAASVLGDPSHSAARMAALKDLHQGQRAWIIGNGPSVRLDDLSAIPKTDIVFCFNRFYMSYDEHSLREDYVVSADTLMVRDYGQDMIDRSSGLPIFCIDPASLDGLRGEFVSTTSMPSSLPVFTTNPSKGLCGGGSSVFVGLQMAHYMGIRDVVLYGIDYSFTMNLVRDPRYPFPVSFEDGNHFIASYRSARPWCPPTWRDISASFLNARVAFEATGGTVVNATRGGRLETFERSKFEDVLASRPSAPAKDSKPPRARKKGLKALFG